MGRSQLITLTQVCGFELADSEHGFVNNFNVSNNIQQRCQLIAGRAVLDLGAHYFNYFDLYPFYFTTDQSVQYPANEDEIYTLLNDINFQINYISLCLWFVKDNSIFALNTCGILQQNNQVFTSEKSYYCSTATGKPKQTAFTAAELQELITVMNALTPALQLQNPPAVNVSFTIGINETAVNQVDYNLYNRISRAYFFLIATRETTFAVAKTALYINLLMSLFTHSDRCTRTNFKTRVVNYHTTDPQERTRLTDVLNKAYTVRSKYVHGDQLPADIPFQDLDAILVEIDDLTRKIFKKIILSDSAEFNQELAGFANFMNTVEAL